MILMTARIFISRTRILAALIVILLASVYCRDASAQTATPTPPPSVPRRDTQQWNDVQLIVPMTTKVDFILLGSLRLGRNLTHPVEQRIGISFSVNPMKSVSLSPSYLHIERQPSSGRSFFEDRVA